MGIAGEDPEAVAVTVRLETSLQELFMICSNLRGSARGGGVAGRGGSVGIGGLAAARLSIARDGSLAMRSSRLWVVRTIRRGAAATAGALVVGAVVATRVTFGLTAIAAAVVVVRGVAALTADPEFTVDEIELVVLDVVAVVTVAVTVAVVADAVVTAPKMPMVP